MKYLVLLNLVVVCLAFVSAATKDHFWHDGFCPLPSGVPSVCRFIVGVNCAADDWCQKGFKCCPEGCGRVCKKALSKKPTGSCPPDNGIITVCMFDPNINCFGDDECPSGYRCCSESCNKICKKAV